MSKTGFILICIISGLIALSSCSKQPGCIDPNAANYIYEAKKDDGSCKYDLSFWMNTGQHGVVKIYVDGELMDFLNCWWPSKKPRCGVDTTVAPGYHCTANIPLIPGSYEVRCEAQDGTVWKNTYTLPENCISILISSPDQ